MKNTLLNLIFTFAIFTLGYMMLSLKEFDGGGSINHTCYNLSPTAINPAGDCLAYDCKDCTQKRINCDNAFTTSSSCNK